MERYFIATEESSLNKDWHAFQKYSDRVREIYREFIESNGIESESYYVGTEGLYIVPTESDKEKFKTVLCAAINDGLCRFKSTSKVGKSWTKTLKDKGVEVMGKPRVIFYFRTNGGRFRSRLFEQAGVLYCSIDPLEGEAPKGFEEIKGSEFLKILEEMEA